MKLPPSMLNKPLAMLPDYAAALLAGGIQPSRDTDAPAAVIMRGVAVIPVRGALAQCSDGYSTGYDDLRGAFLAAMAASSARAVVFDIDSPGGDVAGLFDFVDLIHAARGGKPIVAICSEVAFSAAYAIASACDFITVPRTGGVGSVGVITMLADISKALAAGGVAVHFVHYGAQKAEAGRAELTGVSDGVLSRVQASVDRAGELFVATVARNRGLSVDAVRATEAACFDGELGVAAGLADAVASPDEAFRALLADLDAA